MKDLYTFSKNAWHVKLFKWIYNTDPTQTFNTMCPYFWSMVATILFFPIILVVKLFGKGGTSFLNNLESYKRRKKDRAIALLIEKCSKKDLTNEEAYNIRKSNCWENYNYYIDYDLYKIIINKANEHYNYLEVLGKEKEVKRQQKKEKVEKIKESRVFIITSYITSLVVFSFALYAIYLGFSMIDFNPIDWGFIGEVFILTAEVIAVILLIVALYNYVFTPLYNWLSCRRCTLCQYSIGKHIIAPFKFTWRGILIIADMIYMTYKQACPRITWKDEE